MVRDTTASGLPRDLGHGLVLRRATEDDTEALADFNARVHRGEGEAWSDPPSEGLAAWTRDLMGGSHPACRAEDFTVVEDARAGRIVSSLCLIPQTWTYGGVPFGVGQPEIVGTHPLYRRRGLVRAQIETVHHWSAERATCFKRSPASAGTTGSSAMSWAVSRGAVRDPVTLHRTCRGSRTARPSRIGFGVRRKPTSHSCPPFTLGGARGTSWRARGTRRRGVGRSAGAIRGAT